MYPRHRVVSENLSLPGLSLRQAIERLQRLKFRPHLLLMYSGHNEFMHELAELAARPSLFGALDGMLNWSPTFRVLNLRLRRNLVLQSMVSGVGSDLVQWPISVPEIFEKRRLRFRQNLVQLANFARSRGIPMLWYIPAASESGFEPNRSVVDPHSQAAEVAALNRCFAEATDRERLEDWTGAAECYRAGLAREPQFAEFHFRLGECLLNQGQTDAAQRHFQDALDFDGHPVRLPRPFQQVIVEVGADFSIPVVFTGDALRRHTPTGILDKSLFHDNVHPTLRAFYYMGVAGADVLEKSGLLESRFGRPAEIPAGEFADAVREAKLDRIDLAKAHRGIANGLRWLARFRFDSTRRNEQSDRYVQIARRLETGEIDPGDEGTEALP
jgi:tetratricopeptide (TPR) repeat protein